MLTLQTLAGAAHSDVQSRATAARSRFVTAFPCGEPRPLAASLNFAAGQTIANSVTVKVGVSGAVCLYVSSGTDLVADVDGFTL